MFVDARRVTWELFALVEFLVIGSLVLGWWG